MSMGRAIWLRFLIDFAFVQHSLLEKLANLAGASGSIGVLFVGVRWQLGAWGARVLCGSIAPSVLGDAAFNLLIT